MKKRLKLLLVATMTLISILTLSRVANKETVGDINNDKIVNEVDLELIQSYILGINDLSDAEKKRADTNKDGTIDIVDLANIQKIILGVD